MGRIDFDKKLVEKMYLELFLKLNFNLFNSSKKGAAIPHLDFNIFNNLEIPLPSVAEQKKIVARLEGLLGKIKEAKRLRAEVQEAAQNLLPAELHKIFSHGRHSGWEEVDLGTLTAEIRTGPFGSALHKSDYVEKGIPVVNPQNIQRGSIVPLTKTMISTATRTRLSQYILRENDIVFARRGEMGRCAIVGHNEAGWLCGTGSMVLRLKKEANERFVMLWLQSVEVRKYLEGVSIGSTMSNLNQEILQKIKIPLPPVAEQKKIVAHLDSLSEKIKNLREYQKSTASDFISLEQSILSKAFSG